MTAPIDGSGVVSCPVSTFRGPLPADALGITLMHEHIFVRDPELERDIPGLAWDADEGVERAVATLAELHELGVGTVVDLTVIGLGRDVRAVQTVADRAAVNIVASTGVYSAGALPLYFSFHGPGRLIDEAEPLVELFVRDIEQGIAGTSIRAGMLKVMSTGAAMNEAEARALAAAAGAHERTGVAITTHSEPGVRNGLEQQTYLVERGVAPTRLVIGHSGDSQDLDYLRAIMDAGSTVGLDRFGMEHVLGDPARVDTLVALTGLGYADRIVLSHDAAIYSHVTPPSWRASHAPHWHMTHLSRRILPTLRDRGVTASDIDRMLIENPARLLAPGPG